MAINNSLADFTTYIESLCVAHVDIKHVKDDEDNKHFIELADNAMMQNLKNICYPLVTMDKLSVSYPGSEDNTRKNRFVELMFLDKVNDAGDFDHIQNVKNEMERVAEDFLKKFKIDKRDRLNYPLLKTMGLSDIELNFIENKGIHLYGALLSFSFELPFDSCLPAGRFV